MEEPMNTWRARGEWIVFTENMNGSENGGARDEVEPEEKDVGTAVCGNWDWVGRVVVVINVCPSEADATEGAADIFLQNKDIGELK